MYSLMFSNLSKTLITLLFIDDSTPDSHDSHFWNIGQSLVTSKYFLCVTLFLILLPIVLKKHIKELKIITYLLFTGVITMVIVFFVKTLQSDPNIPPAVPSVTYEKGSIFDSMTIILTSYGFILNFYNVYSCLEVQNNKNGIMATVLAMIFCFFIFVTFSHLGIVSYGEFVHPNIFENLKAEGSSFVSIFIFGIFICIFMCNIPFVFLPGKEALLVLVDEY